MRSRRRKASGMTSRLSRVAAGRETESGMPAAVAEGMETRSSRKGTSVRRRTHQLIGLTVASSDKTPGGLKSTVKNPCGERLTGRMPPKHPPDKHEVPSWEKIYWLCLKVAEDIKRSGFKPDVLVAISRGGWIPGRILSDLLENPNIATIKVEHYVDIYKRIPRPQITQPLPIDVSGKSVLLIDDIADSGKSLQLVREHLLKSGVKEVRIAALYCKPWSVVVPDFYAEETDAWIWFPHERFETAKKMVARLLREGKGEREIRKKLIKIGLKAWLVEKFLRWMRDQGFLPESK